MPAKKFDFEKQLDDLEGIARDLAEGELTLDEAMARYARGIKTYKACCEYLAGADKKVKALTRQLDGSLEEVDFEDSDSFEDDLDDR